MRKYSTSMDGNSLKIEFEAFSGNRFCIHEPLFSGLVSDASSRKIFKGLLKAVGTGR